MMHYAQTLGVGQFFSSRGGAIMQFFKQLESASGGMFQCEHVTIDNKARYYSFCTVIAKCNNQNKRT